MKSVVWILGIGCFLLTAVADAYGPLIVSEDGDAAKWAGSRPTVTIVPEDGDCGSLDGDEMVDLITELFASFTAVTQSTISVSVTDVPLRDENGNSVTGDINLSNYESVTGLRSDQGSDLSEELLAFGQNPMIWDNNCAIIADYLDPSNCTTVLGFAVPYTDTETNAIVRSEEIINCTLNTVANTLRSTIIHEAAHGLGCDHSQLHQEEAENSDTTDNSLIPLMFPSSAAAGDDPTDLSFDDEMCLATLYPESSLTTGFWTLTGDLLDGSSNGVPCANLVLEHPTDASQDLSFVTGTTAVFDGSSGLTADDCVSDCGAFEFKGLDTAVTYTLRVEPVDPSFTGGSSVGRCDSVANSDVVATDLGSFSSGGTLTQTATLTCSSCTGESSTGGGGSSSSSSSSGCSLVRADYL